MPVHVPLTIADPPAAPNGYTLCAFEVRTYESGAGMTPIAVFAGTTRGFEDAANILVRAVESALRDVGVGLRLAAVAWWVERDLTTCAEGRERLVSVYDAGRRQWLKWTPEERIGGPGTMARQHPWTRAVRARLAQSKLMENLHDRDAD